MRDRLKRLREAATKAIDAARTRPVDALKNVTEGFLDKARGLPPEMTSAGSTTAAGLWSKVAPGDVLAQARLAEALVRAGRAGEALAHASAGEGDARPAAILAQAWIARAEAASGKPRSAEARAERAAALLPRERSEATAHARGVLASAALDCGRADLARKLLDGSESPSCLVAAGRLALLEGDVAAATERFERASVDGPDEPRAWRAIALAAAGQPHGAMEVLAPYRGLGPERAWVDLTLGWLRLVGGEPTARSTLALCLTRWPRPPGAHLLLGVLAEREGDLAAALESYRDAAALAPEWAEPWAGVLRAALATGDFAGARVAAERSGSSGESALLAGLALGLAGDVEGAEARWSAAARAARDRELGRDVALLRGALAWRLTRDAQADAATAAWKRVAASASVAGPARPMVARWAADAARRALDRTQPAYYLVEAALAAATALRPESEDLVVGHCSASFLARGPAAARSSLESAVARGASDERITGLLALLDSATRGGPAPVPVISRSPAASAAAALARSGDGDACLAQLEEAEQAAPSPALGAVLGAAKSLARLSQLGPLLQKGRIDEAVALLERALDHVPAGLARDRLIHDLAAVSTLAARRADLEARAAGEPPDRATLVRWQEAVGYWISLSSASAYWAELAKRVLEYDDPRLTPRDVDALRASIEDIAPSLPAALAREAAAAGQRRRARAFVAIVVGAPVSGEAKRRALDECLAPILGEVRRVCDEGVRAAADGPVEDLERAYHATHAAVAKLRDELAETAPASAAPAVDARDELALCLVRYFENLHDRAASYALALDALAAAADLAASETLRAELGARLVRTRDRR